MRADEAIRRLDTTGVPGAPIVDGDGMFRGSVDRAMLAGAGPNVIVGSLADPSSAIAADDGLDDALGILAGHRVSWAPVVGDGRVVGILSTRDVMAAYRRGLAGNVRQVRGVGDEGVLLEVTLAADSPLSGRLVADAGWPRGAVVVSIGRSGHLVIPTGQTHLQVGDVVTLLATPEAADRARAMLS
jgi:CBS domain-containing protein